MTTLNQIRRHSPCSGGWAKLLKHLNKTQGDDEPLSLLTVLESNGLDDAIWCLRTEPTLERIHRFALAVARRVEHLSPALRACNDTTERYRSGQATKAELKAAAKAHNDTMKGTAKELNAARAAAARAAANAARYAADSVDAACAAACAAFAASASAAYAASASAAYAAARTVFLAAERQAQEQLFKEIFA